MLLFESTLLLLVCAVLLAALARRWKLPSPALLAALGAGMALVSGAPMIELDAQLALALFVAPALLDAAYDASPREFRDNWLPIAGLVIVAVALTTAAVACTVKWLMPALSWPTAIALGAVVAPPDAAAAAAVLKQTRLPHRIVQILEGESLFNDATALLIYRVAVPMALGTGDFIVWRDAPLLLWIVAASVGSGIVLARLFLALTRRIDDVPSAIVLQFVGTFGVWLAADRIGLSGVLTVVAYAITIARLAPRQTPARVRLPSYAVWETVVFVLNALAFVLIGLQLRPIVAQLSADERTSYAMVALAVFGVVVAARIAWVMTSNAIARWKVARVGMPASRPLMAPTVRSGFAIAWCGMRGIVTLAAALALPPHFPGRALILVVAFAVVVGTLLLQGLTLRPLLAWFDIRDDSPVEREEAQARRHALDAALARVETGGAGGVDAEAAQRLRMEMEAALLPPDTGVADPASGAGVALRAAAVAAARDAILALRRRGEIGDDAFHRVELDLDRAEIRLESSHLSRR